MFRTAFAIFLCLMVPVSQASSDDAWNSFNQAVATKCKAASGLKRARVSEVIGFDDSLGKVAMLVTGAYSQAALKGQQGRVLCIYDKQSNQAWVDEAKGWRAPDMRSHSAPTR